MAIFRAYFSFMGIYFSKMKQRFFTLSKSAYFYNNYDKNISRCQCIGDHTYFFLRYRSTASKTTITAMAVRTMTHIAVPPAIVMAITTAVAPLRRRSRAQMKSLDLLYPSAARDWCRGASKPFVWPLCQLLLELIKFEH